MSDVIFLIARVNTDRSLAREDISSTDAKVACREVSAIQSSSSQWIMMLIVVTINENNSHRSLTRGKKSIRECCSSRLRWASTIAD